MPENRKRDTSNEADNERREREERTGERKSGSQAKHPDEHADEAIKHEAAERAARAAWANRPVG